jgi:glycosyltransferase involved in cell wall biosynthesis
MTSSAPRPRILPRTLQLVHRLDFGGAELLAQRFAHAFGGPERSVFGCLDEDGPLGERLRQDGFRVVSLNRRPGPLDVRCVRRLRRLIADEKIELVHAHQTTPFFYSLIARGIIAKGPRILFTEHGRFFPDRRSWKRSWIQPRLLGADDRVVAVGESVRLALAVNEGLPWSRIDVVYNGVDLARCEDAGCRRDAIRAESNVARDAFVIAHVARLDPIKNHGLALAAIQRLKDVQPSVVLLVVGDGPERAALEASATSLQLGSNVRFLGSRSDVRRILSAADAAILTSVSEGIPLALIEAMAAGIPVVAAAVGGVPEVVEHGKTGLLVESGDEAGLTHALGSLIADPSLRKTMGAAGLERAKRLFDEQRMFAEYAALLGIDPP